MPRVIVAAAVTVLALVVLGSGGAAFALSLENHDDFCASCHTQPESEYYARSLRRPPPADLASAHSAKQVHCIDCHGGPPPAGRLSGLAQGARDYAAYLSGSYQRPATTSHPLPDANCVRCHADLFADKKLANHWHYYLLDWQSKQPQTAARCVSCHTSHTTGPSLVVKYAFDSTTNPICEACHTFEGIR